jgi:membrane protein YdbS with pleckstrin-like domain
MAYPRRLLNPGEEIALDLKPHWWFFSKQILSGVPLFLVMVVLWFWSGGTLERVTWWMWGLVALAWAAWTLLAYLTWQFTHFVVTSNRVVHRTGVLAKQGVEIPLPRINNINFGQTIWERVIGAGDLEIESAGERGVSKFTDVRHPDAVQQVIYRQMEANDRARAFGGRPEGAGSGPAPAAAAPAPSPSAPPSVAEQIRELAELRDQGLITAAEFEAKKAELLDRM